MVVVQIIVELEWHIAGVSFTFLKQSVYITVSNENLEKNTYNFYLVIEVPDHVYVFYAYRLYFADKDIYMIRYFYHKIEIISVFINSIALGIGHTRSTKRYNAVLY